ncbi:MAG: hypothetical protein NC131_01150 [Roseburia sp.]|nr:hypothetical protein [Roseburia sp.]
MNRRAEHYLRSMHGDGRNPYGSRGGYVTSRDPRHRRDRGEYDDERGMDNGYGGYGRADGHYRGEYEEYPYAKMRGTFEYDRYCDDDYGYDDDMRDYRGSGSRGGRSGSRSGGGRSGGRGDRGDYRGSDYGDYGDDYGNDYRGQRRNSRGQYMSDRRGRSDYGEDEEYKLTKKEMKEWEKNLENADGSKGAHFDKEQIDQTAMQMGIDPKEFGEGVLCMATNMMYSDYCGVARKYTLDRIDYYIDLAKAFLKDKDFDGDGAEKLYLYYTFIANDDD